MMGRIKKVMFGKDSRGDFLLSIIYENNFVQLYTLENIENYDKLKNKIIIDFMDKHMKNVYLPLDYKISASESGVIKRFFATIKKELEGKE